MDKVHVVITGRRNTGKSSIINCILGQNKAVVSDIAGTTTDPVKKSYEIPGVASVVLIDTAGVDDEGKLGQLRIRKTYETIRQADIALLVISQNQFGCDEKRLVETFQSLHQPFFIVHNQSDLAPLHPQLQEQLTKQYQVKVVDFSAVQQDNTLLIEVLKELIQTSPPSSLLGNIIRPGELVMLVTPIDTEAPTGRMILPQVQMLRDILDHHGISIVVQPKEIPAFLAKTALSPHLVITDSQVFAQVAALLPEQTPLTSFSIVLAHHKGNFAHYLQGSRQIEYLHEGDRILILESCSHHTSCEDIGRVKIPALLQKYTGRKLTFDFVAGLDQIPRSFNDYALVVQCGGCMITARQLHNRLQPALQAGIPVTNYGMLIAYVQGIFNRAVSPFL